MTKRAIFCTQENMSRRISWIKQARKAYLGFPEPVIDDVDAGLFAAARGERTGSTKQMKHLGPGVFEIALRHRKDAYRAVYCVEIGADIWVIHAFQKKSTKGISTPKPDIDVIRARLKRLREELGDG